MTQEDPAATQSWAERLLEAMDADEPSVDAQSAATTDDPRPPTDRPWALPPGAVPDHVLVAAMIGHPTPADAELILDDPGSLERLIRHWSATPPDAGLLNAATADPALARLLTAAGHTVPAGGAAASSDRRVAPRRRGYRLAAASSESPRTAQFSGGRLMTQRLPSGSMSVALEFDAEIARALRESQLVASISDVDASPALRVLVILVRSGPAADASLVGRVEVPAGTALEEVEVSDPVPVSELWSNGSPDSDVIANSVAWAPNAWKEAWRQTAVQVGESHPFSRAVARGLSLR